MLYGRGIIMNKFRKMLIFILAFIMVTNVAGCGKEGEEAEDSTTDEETISRDEFDGFDKYEKQNARIGNFVFSIPGYWEEGDNTEEDGYECHQYYAETGEKAVMLEISLSRDDKDKVTYDALVKDNDNMISVIEDMCDGYADFSEAFKNQESIIGRTYEFSGDIESIDVEGLYSVIPSSKDNSWLFVKLIESNKSDYTYENDYKKIIENIKYNPKKETQKSKKKSITSKKKSEKSKEDIIITQDSELFQNMLKMDDSQRSEFAKEYYGATIEFDGSIDYDVNHKDYKTRFDILASYGDYDENHQVGPTFRFRDYSAAQLADDYSLYGLPYYLKAGHNVHIKAIIKECSSDTGVFDLKPIAIKER